MSGLLSSCRERMESNNYHWDDLLINRYKIMWCANLAGWDRKNRGEKKDRGIDRDNETEMEKRWWKSERQWGGKKCQETLKKLNLSSKWLLNKRLRQQNEIIPTHAHTEAHSITHTDMHWKYKAPPLYCCVHVDKHADSLVYPVQYTCAHIAIVHSHACLHANTHPYVHF